MATLGLTVVSGNVTWCRAADGTAAPEASAAAAATPASYRIAPDDVLEITVLNETDLNRTAAVLPDGSISFPYLGAVKAAGMTIPELTHRITVGLARQVARPQVTVTVAHRREEQVGILGAVKQPGKRTLHDGWRVLDLLLDSGGLAVERPEWVSATLVRDGGAMEVPVDLGMVLTGDKDENHLLKPGDVLLVQERDASMTMVQVLGEVAHPGRIPAPRDGSIVSVLLAAGGTTPKAALSKATILRAGQSIPVDLSGVMDKGKVTGSDGTDVVLAPGDTLVIPQNRLWFAVFGAVGKPGAQTFPDDQKLTLVDALSDAGGQTADADLKHASLVTPAPDGKANTTVAVNLEDVIRKGDMSRNLAVPPGSILYLPSKKQGGGGFGLRDALGILPLAGLFIR